MIMYMKTTHWYTVWFAILDRCHIFVKSIQNIDNIISIVSIVRNHVTTCRDPFAADFSLGLGPSVWNPFKIAQMVLLVHWCQGKHYGQLTDESKTESMDDHTCPHCLDRSRSLQRVFKSVSGVYVCTALLRLPTKCSLCRRCFLGYVRFRTEIGIDFWWFHEEYRNESSHQEQLRTAAWEWAEVAPIPRLPTSERMS